MHWGLWTAAVLALLGTGFENGYTGVVVNLPHVHIQQWINQSYLASFGDPLTLRELKAFWSLTITVKEIGQVFGGVAAGMMSDRIGRKLTLIYASVPLLIGLILQAVCKTTGLFEILILGRFICAVGLGMGSVGVPLFLNEIAPINLRGAFSFSYYLSSILGENLAFIVEVPDLLGTADRWFYAFAIPCGFVIGLICVLPFYPDTPRHLFITLGDERGARKSLKFYQSVNSEYIEKAIAEMHREKEIQGTRGVRILELFSDRTMRTCLVLTLALATAKCMSGVAIILSYSSEMLTTFGTPLRFSQYASTGIGFFMLFPAIASLWLVEIVGRRPLVISSCWLMVTALGLLFGSSLAHTPASLDWQVYIYGFCLNLWGAAYSLGMGPSGYAVVGEIWDQRRRAAAQSASIVYMYCVNIVLTAVTPNLLAVVGSYVILIFLVPLSAASAYLTLHCPETKGKTTVEIMTELRSEVPYDLLDNGSVIA